MNFLRLLPVVFSTLLLGAHFLRHGLMPVVILILLMPILLFFRRAWVVRLMQVILILGALEWVRILLVLVDVRRTAGAPWTRLAAILLAVAALTACSALIFQCRSLKARYRLDHSQAEEGS